MRNSSSKTAPASTKHTYLHWILTITLLLLVGIAALLVLTSQAAMRAASDTGHSQQAINTPPAKVTAPLTSNTPEVSPSKTNTPTGTQGNQHWTTPLASTTPTLLPSTPQSAQLGVFSLATGGPLPVPETILRPTNIARVMLNTSLISVYAGSMTQNPQAGILCVLRENLTTGQLNLQVYQDTRMNGPLTILVIQNTELKLTDTKSEGYFDLTTNEFQW